MESAQMVDKPADGIFTKKEATLFSKIINFLLEKDTDLTSRHVIPLNADSDDLASKSADALLLCKLVQRINPSLIDSRVINIGDLTDYQVKENSNLACSAATTLGCRLPTTAQPYSNSYSDVLSFAVLQKRREQILLDFIYQVLKIYFTKTVKLSCNPKLAELKLANEDTGDLMRLSPDDMLKRWFNHNLTNQKHPNQVENWGDSVKDGEKYAVLLNALNPSISKDEILKLSGVERAKKIVEAAQKLGVPPFFDPVEIAEGNPRTNYLFTAAIYNAHLGKVDEAHEDDKNLTEEDREERAFRMFINSLNIPKCYVHNLYEDIKDGLVLLKVLDRVKPGCVDWKSAEMNPNNKYKKVQNANLAIKIGKAIGFRLEGIGGEDLVEGNKKLSLALVWQIVRMYSLKMLGDLTEDKLLEWANSRVKKNPKITSFKDKTLSNGRYLVEVLESIEPRAVNWTLVQNGDSPADVEQNANYLVSVARKMGCTVFTLPQEIREVNPKAMLVLFATLCKRAEAIAHEEEMPDIYNIETTKH